MARESRAASDRRRGSNLPPPTASEAAFERALAALDGAVAEPPPALSAAASTLDDLFARAPEFLARDRFASIGDADSFFTKLVGVSFEGRQSRVADLHEGDAIALVRQPENPVDRHAIAAMFGVLQLGFLRKEIAARLAPKIDAGERYVATVASLTGGGDRHRGVNVLVRRMRDRTRDAAVAPASGGAASDLRRALIGESPLRPAQAAVLERLGDGARTLAVLGTGRGKSFCFQFPAAEAALRAREKTLVFYPLRALANDQYEALVRRLGSFGLRILRANGSIGYDERSELDGALADGSWDVILTTPEFAQHHGARFREQVNRPDFVVVDEAHHLYESRHRPAYVTLGEFIGSLAPKRVLGLTATAAHQAFAAIRETLGIERWVIDATVRDNLTVVDARETGDRIAYLARELDATRKAIVYCTSRTETTKIAEQLRGRLGNCVAFYHAGMPSEARLAVEGLFRSGEASIVVATSAFGEGIDLPDVRDVVLYHLNFDFTSFNQQAGRAGRDGEPARIHLLYGESDRRINDFIIACNAPDLPTLRTIYRTLRGVARDDIVRDALADIVGTIDEKRVDDRTVASALAIFEEAGLIERGTDDDGRFVRFRAVEGRVDLAATSRYAEGEAEREGFDRFCALALGGSAADLEAIVNRPIYPDGIALVR